MSVSSTVTRRPGEKWIAIIAAISMVISLIVLFAPSASAHSDDHPSHDNTNHEHYWEHYLLDRGYTHAECSKIPGESESNFVADSDYALVVIKKGSGPAENAVYTGVTSGQELAPNPDGKPAQAEGWTGYSHVITCTGTVSAVATANVIGECVDGQFVAVVSASNATIDVDLDGNTAIEASESELTTGQYPVTAVVGASLTWQASPSIGAAFPADPPSGSITVLDCAPAQPTSVDVEHELDCEITWNGEGFELYGVVDFNVTPGGVEKIDIFRSGGPLVATWEPGDDPIWLEAWSYEYEVTYQAGFEGAEDGHFEMEGGWFANCSCPSGTVDLSNTRALVQTRRTSSEGEPASPVTIAEGTYHIYLASFDAHSTKSNQDQDEEMWALADASLDSATWISPRTGDLPESVNFMSYHVTASGPVEVPAFDADTLWTVHQGSSSSPNSVNPVCAKLVSAEVINRSAPEIAVVKSASPNTALETGGEVTYSVTISNPSATESVEITSISDQVGEAAAVPLEGDDDCKSGVVLAPGDSCSFTYILTVSGEAGTSLTNTVTVDGIDTVDDDIDQTVSATDDATVSFTDVLPAISVTKTADTNLAKVGDVVTFTVSVSNTSAEPFTITAITDTVFGSLVGDTDCQVGTVLAASASCSFTFQWAVGEGLTDAEIDALIANGHTNTVSVSAEDNENNSIGPATDDAEFPVVEVGGIVITPPAQPAAPGVDVEAEELPFTGFETHRLVGLAILLLGSGTLLLVGASRLEEG